MKQCLLALLLLFGTSATRADLPEITLSIGGERLIAEVASSDPERSQGLMHRRMLPENRGMLFVFPQTAWHGMWMMNTFVPLSVAFIDEQGIIVNIEDMQPQTQDNHMSAKPVRYALEANLGWFKKRGIKPGAKVDGLQQAPAPR
jgi:uncharacterized protein